jgi:hypothetical protein
MVMAWHRAAWLITKRALRPLAMQRSYSSEKSAAVTAVGDPGEVYSMRAYMSPLATLSHLGGLGSYGVKGKSLSAGTQLAQRARLQPLGGGGGVAWVMVS